MELITAIENEDGDEIEYKVDYNYIPEELPVYNPVDRAHPGSPAEIEFNAIYEKDAHGNWLELDEDDLADGVSDKLEGLCFEDIEENYPEPDDLFED